MFRVKAGGEKFVEREPGGKSGMAAASRLEWRHQNRSERARNPMERVHRPSEMDLNPLKIT